MEYYNLEKLIKISICEPRKSYVFAREIKYGLPEGHFIENGMIYIKSKVTLHYHSNYKKSYYFDTYEEAENFVEEIKKSNTWIK